MRDPRAKKNYDTSIEARFAAKLGSIYARRFKRYPPRMQWAVLFGCANIEFVRLQYRRRVSQ